MKTDKNKMPITLTKQNEYLNFLIVMFSVIGKEESDKDITSEGNNVFILQKDPTEITKLFADTSELKSKIFRWFDKRTSKEPLELTAEKSDLLRHCAHAAFYFITEQREVSSARESFIKFYQHYFK